MIPDGYKGDTVLKRIRVVRRRQPLRESARSLLQASWHVGEQHGLLPTSGTVHKTGTRSEPTGSCVLVACLKALAPCKYPLACHGQAERNGYRSAWTCCSSPRIHLPSIESRSVLVPQKRVSTPSHACHPSLPWAQQPMVVVKLASDARGCYLQRVKLEI